jgi:GHH signature containing HNH/Endo VII superfamily nuclease toxin/Pilin (bacterial filament)
MTMNQSQRQFSMLSLLGLLVLGIFVTILTACSEDQPPPPKLTPQQQLLEQQRQQPVKDHTVAQAWQMEQSLVDMGLPGTRAWQKTEKQELLANGFVYGYKGQYLNEVKDSPSLATNPDDIKWVKCNVAPEPATTWQSERRSILLLKAQEAEAASLTGKVKAWFSLELGIGIGIVVLVFLMISFMKTIDGDPGFIVFPFLVIIGIVAWVAIPAWNNYRAANECFNLSEKIKKPVADFYTQKNRWPTHLSEEVCVNPVGKHVYLTTSVDGKTALQCTIEGGEEVSAEVKGKTLLFSYNPQTKGWQCEADSGTLEQKYRPEGCRAK